jgi:hypothetical protein
MKVETEMVLIPSRGTAFLRAVCRIYLIDFVCMRYDLPTPCRDLLGEVHEFTKKIRSVVNRVDEQLDKAAAMSLKRPVIHLRGYGWAEARSHNPQEVPRAIFKPKYPGARQFEKPKSAPTPQTMALSKAKSQGELKAAVSSSKALPNGKKEKSLQL